MIHKVGERVYIRKDLKTGDGDGDWNLEGDMVNYLGRIATITEVEDFGCYSLDIDNGRFGWIDCMFDEGEEIKEFVKIKWQDGTIPEVGRNGVQIAEALEVVLRQLKGYQEKFTCKENAISITKIEEAIMWQEKRTNDRIKRGVEGKHII